MLTRVPANIQVRFLSPQSEEKVPHAYDIKETPKSENNIMQLAKRMAHGTGISIILGLGIYAIVKVMGLELGNFETSVVVFLPALFGFLTSFVIF